MAFEDIDFSDLHSIFDLFYSKDAVPPTGERRDLPHQEEGIVASAGVEFMAEERGGIERPCLDGAVNRSGMDRFRVCRELPVIDDCGDGAGI
jgi:hypothetical protein